MCLLPSWSGEKKLSPRFGGISRAGDSYLFGPSPKPPPNRVKQNLDTIGQLQSGTLRNCRASLELPDDCRAVTKNYGVYGTLIKD
jgi:hypothetical protein